MGGEAAIISGKTPHLAFQKFTSVGAPFCKSFRLQFCLRISSKVAVDPIRGSQRGVFRSGQTITRKKTWWVKVSRCLAFSRMPASPKYAPPGGRERAWAIRVAGRIGAAVRRAWGRMARLGMERYRSPNIPRNEEGEVRSAARSAANHRGARPDTTAHTPRRVARTLCCLRGS